MKEVCTEIFNGSELTLCNNETLRELTTDFREITRIFVDDKKIFDAECMLFETECLVFESTKKSLISFQIPVHDEQKIMITGTKKSEREEK